jgi:hypothetical protein
MPTRIQPLSIVVLLMAAAFAETRHSQSPTFAADAQHTAVLGTSGSAIETSLGHYQLTHSLDTNNVRFYSSRSP